MASYLFRCILLQLSFRAVLTGPEMLVFSEMSFPLFSNLTFHEHIALFENGNEKPEIIARWETKNATITSEWKRSDYMQKIFIDVLDKTLIIWICNVGQTHSAKYEVIYDIDTTGPDVELTIVENKQLDVCLNSPPNSPEKCFGNLTEEQVVQYIEKFLDDHPQYIKRHFEKLTEDEFEKWLDDHPGFMKKYCDNSLASTTMIVIIVILISVLVVGFMITILLRRKKMIMEPISHVETKSVKCIESQGPAALMQTRRKDKLQRLADESNMKLGRIEGTGGIFIPLLKLGGTDV